MICDIAKQWLHGRVDRHHLGVFEPTAHLHQRHQWRPRALDASTERTADARLRSIGGRALFCVRAAAVRVLTRRRPGLHHYRRADAARGVVQPHPGRGEAGRGIPGQATRGRHHHVPHRLQLPRPGHEHRAGLHHPERLVGARREQFGGGDRRRRQQEPGEPARRQGHRTTAASYRQSRQLERVQLPPAGSGPEGIRRAHAGEGPAPGRRAREVRSCGTSQSRDCRPRHRSSS